MELLIASIKARGNTVGTIKHHGHGGFPDLPHDTNKDSDKHFQAGADAASVEGAGILQIHGRRANWGLEDILAIYRALSLDFILIEGYKRSPYAKVVLLRNDADLPLVSELSNVIAVMGIEEHPPASLRFPYFSRSDSSGFADWLMNEIPNT